MGDSDSESVMSLGGEILTWGSLLSSSASGLLSDSEYRIPIVETSFGEGSILGQVSLKSEGLVWVEVDTVIGLSMLCVTPVLLISPTTSKLCLVRMSRTPPLGVFLSSVEESAIPINNKIYIKNILNEVMEDII